MPATPAPDPARYAIGGRVPAAALRPATREEVSEAFRAGRHLDIARYCGRDIRATAELYAVWERYIKS